MFECIDSTESLRRLARRHLRNCFGVAIRNLPASSQEEPAHGEGDANQRGRSAHSGEQGLPYAIYRIRAVLSLKA